MTGPPLRPATLSADAAAVQLKAVSLGARDRPVAAALSMARAAAFSVALTLHGMSIIAEVGIAAAHVAWGGAALRFAMTVVSPWVAAAWGLHAAGAATRLARSPSAARRSAAAVPDMADTFVAAALIALVGLSLVTEVVSPIVTLVSTAALLGVSLVAHMACAVKQGMTRPKVK